MGSIGSIIMFV